MTETTKLVLDKATPSHLRWFGLLDLELEAQFDEERDGIEDCLIKVLLEDDNPIVRHDAAYLLGKLQTKKGITALCTAATSDKSPLVRHEASEILAFLPYTEQTKQALNICLTDSIKEVRETAQIVVDHLEYISQKKVDSKSHK